MTTTAKIRIKVGGVEVECEASESFLKGELPELLKAVSSLYESSGKLPENSGSSSETDAGVVKTMHGAVTTFASRLNVKSGSELIVAACARLTFALNKGDFTRDEIADEMRLATGYFKKSYIGNMTKYLVTLIKGDELVQPSDNKYALSPTKRKALEQQLA